jgi:hypothetical protein
VRKLNYDDGARTSADVADLARAKFELLNKDGLLHFEYGNGAFFTDVAGLANLKALDRAAPRRVSWSQDARQARSAEGVCARCAKGSGKSWPRKDGGGFGVPLVRWISARATTSIMANRGNLRESCATRTARALRAHGRRDRRRAWQRQSRRWRLRACVLGYLLT